MESVATKPAAERDEYRQYLQDLQIVPPSLSQKPKRNECNKRNLQDQHQRALEEIANWKYPPFGSWDHARHGTLDQVVNADIKLANCFYKPKSISYKKKILEAAQHYEQEDFRRYDDAARMYYYLGTLYQPQQKESQSYFQRARELFYKVSYTEEELIKITPREELPDLQDQALRDGEGSIAGKIEWLLGNKDKARELITQNNWFPDLLEKVRKLIKDRSYGWAILRLGAGSKIPFYREIIERECKEHPKCLEMLRNYQLGEDIDLTPY